MGIIFENSSSKYGKLFLIAAFLIIVVSEVSSEQKGPINCRKIVRHPLCRGVAAKRDTYTHGTGNDIRVTAPEDSDIFDDQKVPPNDNFAAVNTLMGLLEKAMTKNLEYEQNSNYVV